MRLKRGIKISGAKAFQTGCKKWAMWEVANGKILVLLQAGESQNLIVQSNSQGVI